MACRLEDSFAGSEGDFESIESPTEVNADSEVLHEFLNEPQGGLGISHFMVDRLAASSPASSEEPESDVSEKGTSKMAADQEPACGGGLNRWDTG